MNRQTALKIIGVFIAIVGIKLMATTSLHWWGLVGGVVCIGLGWGMYDIARDKK